eukprot:CAMPEP_0115384026 /NCGR_PEP_ID=MMETSP0271-20121206/6895_1 /TAXON_ID=71861 /ORGANISM="Scrippsiella trochoidea, Strain CCMP3099" /LENGTH=264 /DNA_ID=CAMNT_0002807367 /DNA_START=100 /DNA_END=893 /DNA_ORIENTATION=-
MWPWVVDYSLKHWLAPEKMQKAAPAAPDGQPALALSLFSHLPREQLLTTPKPECSSQFAVTHGAAATSAGSDAGEHHAPCMREGRAPGTPRAPKELSTDNLLTHVGKGAPLSPLLLLLPLLLPPPSRAAASRAWPEAATEAWKEAAAVAEASWKCASGKKWQRPFGKYKRAESNLWEEVASAPLASLPAVFALWQAHLHGRVNECLQQGAHDLAVRAALAASTAAGATAAGVPMLGCWVCEFLHRSGRRWQQHLLMLHALRCRD